MHELISPKPRIQETPVTHTTRENEYRLQDQQCNTDQTRVTLFFETPVIASVVAGETAPSGNYDFTSCPTPYTEWCVVAACTIVF